MAHRSSCYSVGLAVGGPGFSSSQAKVHFNAFETLRHICTASAIEELCTEYCRKGAKMHRFPKRSMHHFRVKHAMISPDFCSRHT